MANSDKADLVTLAQEGNLPELKRQIAQGENIEQRDIKLRTPLMAATHANQIEVAKYLIEQGANVNARDAIYDSPYLYAGARGLQEITHFFIHHHKTIFAFVHGATWTDFYASRIVTVVT
ncbi:ankyrin repeat domain-containing protein [Proteus mirabilis]|uniref:ankyrin repeat domain-containing protein n=1 Tax=Proteus mirabilis TaxID=584 RepID=UPI003F426EA5